VPSIQASASAPAGGHSRRRMPIYFWALTAGFNRWLIDYHQGLGVGVGTGLGIAVVTRVFTFAG
jgi:hypothetical protein